MLSLIEMKNFRVRAVLSGILSDSGRSLCWREKKGVDMIVRIGCASSYDMDFNDYEFELRLRIMGGDFLPQRHRGAERQGMLDSLLHDTLSY